MLKHYIRGYWADDSLIEEVEISAEFATALTMGTVGYEPGDSLSIGAKGLVDLFLESNEVQEFPADLRYIEYKPDPVERSPEIILVEPSIADLQHYKDAYPKIGSDDPSLLEELQKALLNLPGCDNPRSPQDIMDVAWRMEALEKKAESLEKALWEVKQENVDLTLASEDEQELAKTRISWLEASYASVCNSDQLWRADFEYMKRDRDALRDSLQALLAHLPVDIDHFTDWHNSLIIQAKAVLETSKRELK